MIKLTKDQTTIALSTSFIALLIGLMIGLCIASRIDISNKLTTDALVQSLATLLGILAATIILPLKIQPLLSKQDNIINVTQEDVRSLLALIEEVLSTCEQFHLSGDKLSVANRKLILARHKQIHSLAGILKSQSTNHPALSKFDEKIYQPLNDSHNDFADNVVNGQKLTDVKYLRIVEQLNPVITELRSLRYELN